MNSPAWSGISGAGCAPVMCAPVIWAAVVAAPDSTVTCHSFRGRGWDRQYRPDGPLGSRANHVRGGRVRCVPGGAHSPAVPMGRPAPDDIALLAVGGYVARMIVEVMLKPEIHDPQGDAIASACHRLGFGQVLGVRQGKRFEVELEGPADDAAVTAITNLARELLSNPVIEEFTLHAG